ncbi:hypothetical protein PI861_00025 [Aeromonas salmonicida subsp. salmonicida]|uniref:hypothetical protein n=1 Tax=Aeromonas salmonicida TaxID=645 RepID=UPI001EE43A57|nr:hypothetical protein [Aeromonas salmonicida]WCB54613.1 hypothetical protein PI861_00025 [Aeromonas salmonicida subsp. salmonicida]
MGGLRAELNEVKKVTPGAKPVGLWLDIYRAGSLLDAWVNHFSLTLSVPELTDYLDANGHQHHVAKVASSMPMAASPTCAASAPSN